MAAPPTERSTGWPWLARITDGNHVLGCGFHVGDGLVVTAAHVLPKGDPSEGPAGEFTLEFPFLGAAREWSGHVVSWHLDEQEPRGDLALLRLSGDPGEIIGDPPPMIDDPVEQHRCRAYGFPTGFEIGVWAIGTVVGPSTNDLWQLEISAGPGFGGTAVWDDDAGGVVGMLVAAAREQRIATMVSVSSLRALVDAADEPASGAETVAEQPVPEQRPASDQVRWLTDFPATNDSLKRIPLARALVGRLEQIQAESAGRSFLIHLDGEWGAGKTSLLNFIQDEAGGDWLVVDFNAWRQSRMGPPWWSLLTDLRSALRQSLAFPARVRLRAAEILVRLRRGGGIYLASLLGVLTVLLVLFMIFRPATLDVRTFADLSKALTGALAAVAALWGAALLAARLLLWDSPRGAKFYETSNPNPAQSIAEHFAWLIRRSKRPVLFLIDDLDRAAPEYVVELIETVQTLIRDAPHRDEKQRSLTHGCHFVVAADGTWIRQSFESRYEVFKDSIAEPGRPLGYLFLDKIFQLTVAVPAISESGRNEYLRDLLGVGTLLQPEQLDAERAALEKKIQASTSEKEIIDALRQATPVVREVATPQAIDRLHSRAVEATREHFLQQFAGLLAPNPRSMKRYVIANSLARTVLTLEGDFVAGDSLALWLVLQTRWPALAAHLQTDPATIDLFANRKRATAEQTERLPETLRPLLADEAVRRVLTFSPGGPLTPDLILHLTGRWANRPPAG